jgi:hypothetical protein
VCGRRCGKANPPDYGSKQAGDSRNQPSEARIRVDHVVHMGGVVVPVPLDLVIRSPQRPLDHVAPPVCDGETGQGFGM